MTSLNLQSAVLSARHAAGDVAVLGRLTRDLPGFLRRPVTLEQAVASLQHRLATREQAFLGLVEHGIYARPRNPFARLLRHAGCELGDLRALVAHEGIEGALGILADRGVYLSFDEMKGRRETVRGSQRFLCHERDLDRPLEPPHVTAYTGGTGGRPIRVGRSLGALFEQSTLFAATLDAHGLHNPGHVIWLTAPFTKLLNFAFLGQDIEAWLHPLFPLPVRVRVAGDYLSALGRLGGYSFPKPAFLDLRRPERLARWLAWRTRSGRPLMVTTTVSSATRVAVAAVAAGLDLPKVTFYVQGEPITPARRAHIESAGARVIVSYGTIEIMTAAFGCAMPTAVDDVHVALDRHAVIAQRREVGLGAPPIDMLLFSTIGRYATRVLLNADLGDYGQITQRDCDCALGTLGWRTHLTDVRSFEKLTGEGMTFVRSDLARVLEEVLPARFGGSSTDYQLLEEVEDGGASRLVLRIHPTIPGVDEDLVRTTLTDELRRGTLVNAYMADMWSRAGTITISRQPPLVTPNGKTLPIYLLRPPARSTAGAWSGR